MTTTPHPTHLESFCSLTIIALTLCQIAELYVIAVEIDMKYSMVKLTDGRYLGNRISGSGFNTFVPVDESDAVRFNSESDAKEAIVEYELKNATVVKTDTF